MTLEEAKKVLERMNPFNSSCRPEITQQAESIRVILDALKYEKIYKEALGRANDIKSGKVKLDEGEPVTDYIFPELAESEDEKVMKYKIYRPMKEEGGEQ